MADAFPVSGNIDSTEFPHLLVDLHRQGATGSLKVNGPVHPKALYFRAGRVLFGSSNDPRDQLGAILIESGKITREQLDEVNQKVGPGNPLAKVLAESGFVNQRELGDAARIKVERILSDVLSWSTGSFEFEDGVLPKGAVDLKLSTEKLLLAAVQRIGDREFVLRHLGGDMSVLLEATPDGEDALGDIRAEVWPLLERLDGERTLEDAVSLTRLDEFDAAKTACAMLFLGIVRRKEGGGSELDLAEQALSGFGEQPAEGASPPPGSAPVVEPAEETPAFVVPDGEPPPAPTAPGAEPIGIQPEPDSEPVGVQPEPVGVQSEPVGVQSEPLGIQPEPTASPAGESTDFAFVTAEEDQPPIAAPAAPDELQTVALPTDPVPTPVEAAPAPPMEAPPPSFAVDPPSEPPPSFAVKAPPEPGPPLSLAEPPPPPDAEPSAEISIAAAPVESAPAPAEPPAEAAPVPFEAPPAEPAASDPDPSSPDSSARPTQEDLAALDALLNPSASGKAEKVAEAPQPDAWEPQFQTGGVSSASSGPSASTRRAVVGRKTRSRSRAPLFAGLAGVAIVAVAAGYFFLGRSSEPTSTPAPPATQPTTAPTPALSAPVTVAAAPSPQTTPDATTTPAPAATAPTPETVSDPPPTAPPPPAPTPVPPPTAPPQTTAAPARDPLALLRQGAFNESAQASAAVLGADAQGRYSIQVLAACSPDTIRKAAQNVSGDEIFLLPVNLNGRACFRMCWGVFDTREAAAAGTRTLPDYFRQPDVKPRIQPLSELLP